jgi:modulator of FtsH protease
MNDPLSTVDYTYAYSDSVQARNKVLRNTYWLLSLTLIPTVLGAWAGVELGLGQVLSGGLGLVLFLAVAFGFIYAIERTKNSAVGVPILLGFTFFMGLMLSRLIESTLGLRSFSSARGASSANVSKSNSYFSLLTCNSTALTSSLVIVFPCKMFMTTSMQTL